MHKINCQYCDKDLEIRHTKPIFEYVCPRCNSIVYRSGASTQAIVLLSTSTLIMLFWTLISPICTIFVFDAKSRSIIDSLIMLFNSDYTISFVFLITTIVVVPVMMILLINIIIFEKYLNIKTRYIKKLIKIYNNIKYWNMAEVYLLAILISMIKLNDLTDMSIQYGLWFNFVYILFLYLTIILFNPNDIIGNIHVKKRDKNALIKSFIYLIVALIFLIPSNILPIMPTYEFSVKYDNTIYDGIQSFLKNGDYLIAFIIFFASICLPILKIIGIFTMIIISKYKILLHYKKLMTKLHIIMHALGKYSMVDVFVVVIVSTFMQYDNLFRVGYGDALLPFTLVVFFTMLSSNSFDARLLWEENQ